MCFPIGYSPGQQEGTCYEPENIREMPDLKGVTFHVAASAS